MTHFLVTYDRDTQNSEFVEFHDGRLAMRAFAKREREMLGNDRVEIVLLSANTIEEVRITHPNFFEHGNLLPSQLA